MGANNEDSSDPTIALSKPQVIIVQQILAHDTGVLSLPELKARNPDLDADALQHHLDTLVSCDILVELDAPKNQRNLPSVFYAVTERGISLLKQTNLYDEIAVWNDVYNHVPVPEDLQRIEDMERPTPDWYDQYKPRPESPHNRP